MKLLIVFISILGYYQSASTQTVTTLEASSFLVRSIPDTSVLRRDLLVRDSLEKAKIIQDIITNDLKSQLETGELSSLNTIVMSPSKAYCVLYSEGETDTRRLYIAEKKGHQYVLVEKIDGSFSPAVRFSRDGNAMVVFNPYGDNFLIYTHKRRAVHHYEDFKYFGIQVSIVNDMLISNDGKILAVSTSGLIVLNIETKKILYKLPGVTNFGLISFSSDHNFIFISAGTRIQDLNADYIIVDIAHKKVKEIINIPPREYKAGLGYINAIEADRTPYCSLVIHDLDKNLYYEYKMK